MSGRDTAFYQQCEQVEDWEGLFAAAFEQGVAGVLVHRMASVEFSAPVQPRQAVARRLALDRLWHRRMTADLGRVLDAFEVDGLRAIVLKGPVLSERLYPDASLRASGDLDLLVRPVDMARAQAALERIGYARRSGTPPLHAAVFDCRGGGTVDLHHRASGGFGTTLGAEDFLARSVPYRTAAAGEAWILSPEDEFLYLAVHAARHRFLRLRWLYDLRLFVRRHPDLSWQTIGTRAQSFHVRRSVSATCEVLEKRLQVTLPDTAAAHLRRDAVRSRAAVLVASLSAIESGGIWRKSYRVFWHVTYQALLGEGLVACSRFWWRSLAQAAVKVWRGWPIPRSSQASDLTGGSTLANGRPPSPGTP